MVLLTAQVWPIRLVDMPWPVEGLVAQGPRDWESWAIGYRKERVKVPTERHFEGAYQLRPLLAGPGTLFPVASVLQATHWDICIYP